MINKDLYFSIDVSPANPVPITENKRGPKQQTEESIPEKIAPETKRTFLIMFIPPPS